MTLRTWVIGRRGLLGSALGDTLLRRPSSTVVNVPPLPWGAEEAEFRRAVREALALMDPDEWCIAWCAGASVTGASSASVERELAELAFFLDETARWSGTGGTRLLFYASSAGGLYAGSKHPPFSEATPAVPLSPYGIGKLAAEELVRRFADRTGARALCGRIANLYGPAQSLAKGQGLITHLARAQLSPAPVSIYVPLETTRDYIHAEDAAELIADCLYRLASVTPAGETVVKVLATHQPASIASLLAHFSILSKAHPNVMLGSSSAAAYQAVDLRLDSVVWADLDRRPMKSLPEGISTVLQQMLFALQDGQQAH